MQIPSFLFFVWNNYHKKPIGLAIVYAETTLGWLQQKVTVGGDFGYKNLEQLLTFPQRSFSRIYTFHYNYPLSISGNEVIQSTVVTFPCGAHKDDVHASQNSNSISASKHLVSQYSNVEVLVVIYWWLRC